jgi:hypothetical protein
MSPITAYRAPGWRIEEASPCRGFGTPACNPPFGRLGVSEDEDGGKETALGPPLDGSGASVLEAGRQPDEVGVIMLLYTRASRPSFQKIVRRLSSNFVSVLSKHAWREA